MLNQSRHVLFVSLLFVIPVMADTPQPAVSQDHQTYAGMASDDARWKQLFQSVSDAKTAVPKLLAAYDLQRLLAPEAGSQVPSPVATDPQLSAQMDAIDRMPLPSDASWEPQPNLWARLDVIDPLLAEHPDQARLYLLKAQTLWRAGQYFPALNTITHGVACDPGTACLAERARYWKKINGNDLRCLADLLMIIQRAPAAQPVADFCFEALHLQRLHKLKSQAAIAQLGEWLARLEDTYPDQLRGHVLLLEESIAYWKNHGNPARARANLAMYKQTCPDAYKTNKDIHGLEQQWADADRFAASIYHHLPKPPDAYATDLTLAIKDRDAQRAWQTYRKWSDAQPQSVRPRLYAAAVLLDLDRPILAINLLRPVSSLSPTDTEKTLAQGLLAMGHAAMNEPVAAAIAQDHAGGQAINGYWLAEFLQANQEAAYQRIVARQRALLLDPHADEVLAGWTWISYQQNASKSDVVAMEAQLRQAGHLPSDPMIGPRLPEDADALARVLKNPQRCAELTVKLDTILALGGKDNQVWQLMMKVSNAQDRADDAAFAAACLLTALPEDQQQTPDAKLARSLIAASRSGVKQTIEQAQQAAKDRERAKSQALFAQALRRNPCDVEAMVAAYDSARELHDLFGADRMLRRIWLAYGDDQIDLDEACNVAVGAADWDLLMSISQAALAKTPTDHFRAWYEIATMAGQFDEAYLKMRDSLMWDMDRQAYNDALMCWADLAKPRGGSYMAKTLKTGQYAQLCSGVYAICWDLYYKAIVKKEDTPSSFWTKAAQKGAERARSVLSNPQDPYATHYRYLAGQLSEQDYQKATVGTPLAQLAVLLQIIRPWKMSLEYKLNPDQAAQISAVMMDNQQPLGFRLLAYRMLVAAGIASDIRPVRATDLQLTEEDYLPKAGVDVQKGRGLLANDWPECAQYLVSRDKYATGSGWAKDPTYEMIPKIMSLQLSPDLPGQVFTLSQYKTAFKQMATTSLKPAIERILNALVKDLDKAGNQEKQRWNAYRHCGDHLYRLHFNFKDCDQVAYSEQAFAMLRPYMLQYPKDTFVAMLEVTLLDAQVLNRLSEDCQKYNKIGAAGYQAAYRAHKVDQFYDGDSPTYKALMAYQPGTAQYNHVLKIMSQGYTLQATQKIIADEQQRAADEKAKTVSQIKCQIEFEQCMRNHNYHRMADLAYTLGGQYFVRWALVDKSVRLDELCRARGYATDSGDIEKLRNMINNMSRPRYQSSSSYSSSFGGNSYASFNAEMAAKRKAGIAAQHERDLKNNIFYDKSLYEW